MKQKPIGFRELLERLLPLDELPPVDRFKVDRALRGGVAARIEEAALTALARLEQRGAIRRLPAPPGSGTVLRYQSPRALDLITVQLSDTADPEGVRSVPRASLPGQAQAGLDQVRHLLRLDEAVLGSDPRDGGVRHGLLEQLDHAGCELLDAAHVRFIPAVEMVGGAEPFDHELAVRTRQHPDRIFYCPDLLRVPRLSALARERHLASLALAAVAATAGEPLGVLEVASRHVDPFRPDELAMVALLADSASGVLERAARIEKLVFVDPLTSVYNRSYFDLQLRNEMARAQREHSSMALCIADIDDFKSFNTAFGYEAGNQVLIQVAQALRRGVRPFDTVARWGGEEFAVLLTAPVLPDDVITVSERLRTLVERQEVRLEGLDQRAHHVGVTVSVGVAMYPNHAEDAAELWRASNRALLEAKRPPKNRVVFYRPGEGAPLAAG